jgi:hypothetical protein
VWFAPDPIAFVEARLDSLEKALPIVAAHVGGRAASRSFLDERSEAVSKIKSKLQTLGSTVSRQQAPPKDVDEDAENELIREQLNEPLSMPFPNQTSFQDVIKYIKTATRAPKLPDGIPIYIDPQGLKAAAIKEDARIVINLEGVKIKTSLRLLLKQLGLGYVVKDGLLIITNLPSDELHP